MVTLPPAASCASLLLSSNDMHALFFVITPCGLFVLGRTLVLHHYIYNGIAVSACCCTGTTAQSCSIRLVLGNLCWHLASLAGVDVLGIPEDYSGLVSYFYRMLKVCS